jgi:hypothetical protein
MTPLRGSSKKPQSPKDSHVAVGHVEGHGGDPGELDDFMHLVRQAGKLQNRGGGEKERHQHRAGTNQAHQKLEGRMRVMAVAGVPMFLGPDAGGQRDFGNRLGIEQPA